MRPRLILLVVLLLAPFATAGTASAQPKDSQSQRAQPLDRLLPEIRRNNPGQFLDAEGINRNGAPGYRLKWLTPEGRVIERDIDARNGRTMGGAPERGYPQRGYSRGEENGPPPERPRANFQQNFNDAGDDEPRPRFGNRGFGPRPDVMQDRFGQDRFNRPAMGDGDARGPGAGFGGEARPGFGNGRNRGRGREE
jgi:hypothetical protein